MSIRDIRGSISVFGYKQRAVIRHLLLDPLEGKFVDGDLIQADLQGQEITFHKA